jgi:hypothetical protein
MISSKVKKNQNIQHVDLETLGSCGTLWVALKLGLAIENLPQRCISSRNQSRDGI